MKVFYLSSSAFSDNQMSLFKHLGKHHDITYAVIKPLRNSNYTKEELAGFCEMNNIRFEFFELQYRFRDPRVIKTYLRVIKAIKKANPDIIYFANFDQLYLNVLLLLVDRSKTIIGLHDVENHSQTAFSFLGNLGKKVLVANFWHFHTYSVTQQNLLKSRIPGKNVYNISLPLIDFGKVDPIPPKKGITRFLFFGNILYYKGLDLLLKPFINTAAKYPGAELIIAGRCADWAENYAPVVNGSRQIKHHIRFIDNKEIPVFFAQADYVVLPYRDTTQSGPLMIAFNYNIPVLVSKAQGFSEFTSEGETGYSFDAFDGNDIERVLETCMQSTPADYNNLKIKLASYVANHYSVEAIIEKYRLMFESVQSFR
ncbi:MAG: glycosyltransferase family 4 protein [Chitinophagaceae bacterium]